MRCDRCGREPDADLIRHVQHEADEEVDAVLLCPECSYGMNVLRSAYVAGQLEVPAALDG